jgi:hypothetical protein
MKDEELPRLRGPLMSQPELYVLTRSDLADVEISPAEVISAVREGYLALANGASRCPTKLMMPLPDAERDAVSYSMLGYDANSQQVGFKSASENSVSCCATPSQAPRGVNGAGFRSLGSGVVAVGVEPAGSIIFGGPRAEVDKAGFPV